VLEKHKKYRDKYGSNEIYWGLGIEEETYFQFTKPIHVATPIIRSCHKPERYSVDYYATYKPGHVKAIEALFPDASGCVPLPFFVNSHCFTKMDVSGNHATTYEKKPQPNPKFSGKTFLDELQAFSPLFKDDYEVNYTFDGDSLEFITLGFYKAKAADVIKELVDYKKKFLEELNRFLEEKRRHREKGRLFYPPRNPGFAVFYSNPANVVMFNNGTYHINLTLPSIIGSVAEANEPAPLAFPDLFKMQHRQCIRMIQWLEPFLIAVYGTADPLSSYSRRYTKASQRCCVSRYIGIGTYDIETMPEGKILTIPVSKVKGSDLPYWWYSKYHKMSGYNPLEQIGMDINYRKHYNHGIEMRFFDWFAEERLEDLVSFLVHLCEAALERQEMGQAIMSQTWNQFVIDILKDGAATPVTGEIAGTYEKLLGIQLMNKKLTAASAFDYIFKELKRIYKNGECVRRML
jgi:hypothetical protein